ncbi:MAG: ROK family protein [Chloroflexaceae bacterium]|nr:ROK family protein [Chloroflexaceae bacterium]
MQVLGLDVGGSGIKGALVDTRMGTMITERHRIPTPQPATPAAVVETIAAITGHFGWCGPVGCGFPAVVKGGVVLTAANIDSGWVGLPGKRLLEEATGCPVWLLNDADAAGMAEMVFGAGQGQRGLVLVITLGTGIGTAVFSDGHLVPNIELGHIELHGKDAETYASDGVRKKKDLTWEQWAHRVDEYLHTVERLLWPDLMIIGGGVSKKHEKFLPLLTAKTPVVPAVLRNEAGIIGAALAARHSLAATSG